MFRHSIETCNHFLAPFPAFDFVQLPCAVFLDTLPNPDMVRVYYISEHIYSFCEGIYSLVRLNGQMDCVHPLMNKVSDLPKIFLAVGENKPIIAVSIEITHTQFVLEIVVEMNGEEQVR